MLNKTLSNCNTILFYDIMQITTQGFITMKPTMVTAICLLAGIIIMSSFGLQLDPTDAVKEIPENIAANILYVCPTASTTWDPIANGFTAFIHYLKILLVFGLIVVAFSWFWAFYQNLLKDKFDADKYKTPWGLTKMMMWGVAIFLLLIYTPNHFRTVHVKGINKDYVLCEAGDDGAMRIRADIVSH